MRCILPLALAAAAASLALAAPQDPPRLLVYPGDRTLIEEIRTVALPAGPATVRVDFVRGNADVTSLEVVPLDHPEQVRVVALRRRNDLGNTTFVEVEAGLAVLERLRFSYVARGLATGVSYEIAFVPAAGTVDLVQELEVTNRSGESLGEVAVHAVFGEVKTVQPSAVLHGRAADPAANAAPGLPAEPLHQEFAEHTIVSFGDPVVLASGITIRRRSLERRDLPATVEFRYDVTAGAAVRRHVKVPNQGEKGLGGLTLQPGALFLVEREATGGERFLLRGALPHVPPGKELELAAGPAVDFVVERNQTDVRRSELVFGEYNRALVSYAVEESWLLEIRNHSQEARTLLVTEHVTGGQRFEVLESSVPVTKQQQNTVEFRVEVPAGEKVELRYRVKKHGVSA